MAEYAPQAIKDLFDQIKAAIPSAILSGIIGDQAHTYGYHRGRHYVSAGDYSVQYHPEDTTGDGEAACGLDISYSNAQDHYTVSQRMLDAANDPRMENCREYYGSVNGWDVSGYDWAENHPATSDPSHCWHGHWGFDRSTATSSLRAIGDVITGGSAPIPPPPDERTSQEMFAVRDTNGAIFLAGPGIFKGMTADDWEAWRRFLPPLAADVNPTQAEWIKRDCLSAGASSAAYEDDGD